MIEDRGGRPEGRLKSSPGSANGAKGSGVPWGPHRLPLAIDLAGVEIEVAEKDGFLSYIRHGAGDDVIKGLMLDSSQVLFSPVEPLNKPSSLSAHLLIEFARVVIVEPKSTNTVYVSFPIEIAAALKTGSFEEHVIDIFSLSPAKYTLYGNVKSGVVSKHWKSEIYSFPPALNPLEQGVMKLVIENPGTRWAEVGKALFSAYGMKLFFGPGLVSSAAVIRITGDATAETTFTEEPLKPGMVKAIELFSLRLLGQQGKALMEEGY